MLGQYNEAIQKGRQAEFFRKPLDQLFDEYAFESSRPPFSFAPKQHS